MVGMVVAAFVGLNVHAGYGVLLGVVWMVSVIVGIWGIARLNRAAIKFLHEIDTERRANAN